MLKLSFKKSIFPDNLKAKIRPVFNTGDNAEPSNYRPISVLPCLTKVQESVFHNTDNYLIQAFSIKIGLIFRKGIQLTISTFEQFYNL